MYIYLFNFNRVVINHQLAQLFDYALWGNHWVGGRIAPLDFRKWGPLILNWSTLYGLVL